MASTVVVVTPVLYSSSRPADGAGVFHELSAAVNPEPTVWSAVTLRLLNVPSSMSAVVGVAETVRDEADVRKLLLDTVPTTGVVVSTPVIV